VAERTAVYRPFNADGALLYVGITDDIATRWRDHAKVKPWWPQVVEQRAMWYPTREDALAVEGRAIETESPLYNINASPGPTPMPNRAIRMSDEMWMAFGVACKSLGVTRSHKLREHMRNRIGEWQAEKELIARESAES
jgi:hypothetical protein